MFQEPRCLECLGAFNAGGHLFSFRTQKLSPVVPMVVLLESARVGRCQDFRDNIFPVIPAKSRFIGMRGGICSPSRNGGFFYWINIIYSYNLLDIFFMQHPLLKKLKKLRVLDLTNVSSIDSHKADEIKDIFTKKQEDGFTKNSRSSWEEYDSNIQKLIKYFDEYEYLVRSKDDGSTYYATLNTSPFDDFLQRNFS